MVDEADRDTHRAPDCDVGWLDDATAAVVMGSWTDPVRARITVGQWSSRWPEAQGHLKPSMRTGYASLL